MKPQSILIIEDDLVLGETTAELLQLFEYDTKLVRDGLLALEAIDTIKPDFILLDLHLPNKSGLDVLAEIRSEPRLVETKIILVTADAFQAQNLEGQVEGVVIKPYEVVQLIDLLTQLAASP
jgi:two-component system, chemotaxis family, chemotaxis protein CheY